MLGFTEVVVSSFDLDTFVVRFAVELNPPTRPVTDFQFFVERSTAEAGPFDVLNPTAPLVDTYTFTDTQVNRLSKWRRFYYRVRAVDTTGAFPVETISPLAVLQVPTLDYQQRVRREIIRNERLLLNGNGIFAGFINARCLIFNRRTFGQRCPECWDPVKKSVGKSRCFTCYGVGFKGGYHTPIRANLAFGQTTEIDVLTPLGTEQPHIDSAWLSVFPTVTSDDLIVSSENARYRVKSRRSTENSKLTVRQLLELIQLQPGEIEYLIQFDPALLEA